MTVTRTLGALAAGAIVAMAFGGAANATTSFNQALVGRGFYAGGGNPNAGFTVDTTNGVELGLGVHYRYGDNVSPSPLSGNVYNVQSGGQTCYTTSTCALWNIDFSINLQANSDNTGLHLSDIVPTLTVENQNTSGIVSFNLLDAFPDNYGWDGTARNTAYNPYSTPIVDNRSTDFGVQNSENLIFSPFATGTLAFDPTANGSYLVTLAYDLVTPPATSGGVAGASALPQVQIQINATPIPASLPLFAGGLGLMGFLVRRKKRKSTATKAAA